MGRQKTTVPASKVASGSEMVFPRVGGVKQPRTLSSPSVLRADQIVLYPDALTAQECSEIIGIFDSPSSENKLEPSPPARKGEANRTNQRFSQVSPEFAKQLYEKTGIQKEVAAWPSMFGNHLVPVGLSSNIRVYRYSTDQVFEAHYDQESVDPFFGSSFGKSEWTVLFYLTGIEDGVDGGQTVFYTSHTVPKRKTAENTIQAPLLRGAALFHRHGKVSVSSLRTLVLQAHLTHLSPGLHATRSITTYQRCQMGAAIRSHLWTVSVIDNIAGEVHCK
jgi:hypothetical protein